MKKISLIILVLCTLSGYSQKGKEKVSVKKENQIFFYPLRNREDSIIVKSKSDLFYLKLSEDKKPITEIIVKNGEFARTTDEHIFKLLYTPGMQYKLSFIKDSDKMPLENSKPVYKVNIETDGACSGKGITIDLIDLKTDKVLLSNYFEYREK